MPRYQFLKLYAIAATILFVAFAFNLPHRVKENFFAEKPPPPNSYLNSEHWAFRDSIFKHLSVKDKVVFVGNSLIENCPWGEILQSNNCANRGIAGDRSIGVTLRIGDYLADTPRCIVLVDNINDITQAVPLDSTIQNNKQTIDKVLAAHVPLVVMSTPYVTEKYDKGQNFVEGINKKVDSVNNTIKSYCQQRGAVYLNLNTSLSANGALNPSYTIDGEHINFEGYKQWVAMLRPTIQQYL